MIDAGQSEAKESFPDFRDTKKANCTHAGNGERFVLWYGGRVRYCPAFDWWYVWNSAEGRWVKDDIGLVYEVAKEALRLLYIEAAAHADSEKRKALSKWAAQCEAPGAINQMLEWARTDPVIAVHFEVFDPDPLHLNLMNGWLDLQSMTINPHSKDRYFSMVIPVEYNPVARCPNWLAFLDRIFRSQPNKDKLISFLQRAVGYTLTGETHERAVFLMHGLGANGKTVFISVLEALFGDYGTSVSSTTFTTAMSTNVRNDLARLKGKRFVWASENSSDTVLDEELIKKVSGGDESIICRFLFKEEFSYKPNFKVWWIFNHKPKIRDSTDSIWDRIHLVPCEERIPKEERDKRLAAKLKKELPGILNWALFGYKEYLTIGLEPPVQVLEATKEYRHSEDVLADFLTETFDSDQTSFGDVRMPFKRVWELWTSWCNLNNEKIRSKTWMGRQLGDRFKKYHDLNDKGYIGLKIKQIS